MIACRLKQDQGFTSNIFMDPYESYFSHCSRIEEQEIFSEMRKVTQFRTMLVANDLPGYQIVKGIGFYSVVFLRSGGFTLKYAIIKGVEYGGK